MKITHLPPPDRSDRMRALTKLATLAARGSPVHWQRLRRLPEPDKQTLWATLPGEVKGQLKAQAASLRPIPRYPQITLRRIP